jgi:hypothetical protein
MYQYKKMLSVFTERRNLIIIYLFLSVLILVNMNSLITQYPIRSDADQNLQMSYNLYKHGVISLGNTAAKDASELSPTNYREPVPIIINALFMFLHPEINREEDSYESFQNGENTKLIKQVNLFWIFLLLIGSGCVSYLLTKSSWVPFFVLCLIYMYFIRFGNHFDILYTELHGATLITLASLFLMIVVKKKTIIWYVSTGIVLGLLVLTKAAFFYLSILAVLFLYYFGNGNKSVLKIGSSIVGVLLVILPWMIRNYTVYESFEVSQRAGAVLHLRATHNQMYDEELIGAIYFWGPQLYRDLVQNTSLGANEEDFQEGGRFERLNRVDVFSSDSIAVDNGHPDQAIKFYSINRAEINRLQKKLGTGGEEASRHEAYQIMKDESFSMILDNPIRHTFISLAFLWRGMWCFPNSTLPFVPFSVQTYIHNVVNLMAYFSIYIVFFYGLFKKKTKWIAVTIIPLSWLLLHGLTTHNISRFSEPIIPSMIISLVFLINLIPESVN